ncbi:neuronal acetylcholine receptor subunit alpha-7-like isoform X2 [Watersipora subatra]|uniref:neuronal acetylcholine receptor subunit alpha-7-like isoform X2 n=1 Tax=Watersipora subatra TaxID=2589382 RepID=UPI00355BD42F
MDVDEKNQVIQTNLWLIMQWSDYKLAWNPADYENITEIRLPAKLLWKPDILIADPKFDGSYPVNMVVYNSGFVQQMPPGIFTSSCLINIRWFPFDIQSCQLKFGSWTYDGTKINLKVQAGVSTGSTDGYRKSGEWDLLGVPVERNVVLYDCCPDNPYIDLTYSINVRRRKLYYLVNIVLPCVMLAVLTLLTFTIPCEAGEKISFSVTILLSLTVFQLMVAEALPATSDAVPVIAVYFCCVMLLNSSSVAFAVLVLSYHHRGAMTHRMPAYIKNGICVWLAWLLRMKQSEEEEPRSAHHRGSSGKVSRLERQEYSTLSSKSLMCNIRDEDDYSLPGSPHLPSADFSIHKGKEVNRSPSPSLSDCTPTRTELRTILKELRLITEQMKKKQEEEKVVADWKFASRVIDRLLLWVFLILTLTSTCAILLTVPNMFASSQEIIT